MSLVHRVRVARPHRCGGRRALVGIGLAVAVTMTPAASAEDLGPAHSSTVESLTAGASAVPAQALSLTTTWSVPIADGSNPIALSSPTLATLDGGGPAAVVGDRAGYVYALHLSNGSEVAGWPVRPTATGAPIDSSPSVSGGQVFVGAGNSSNAAIGGYESYDAAGAKLWQVDALPTPASPAGSHTAVQAGMAIGTLQGRTAEVAGTLGEEQDALTTSGGVLGGFPWFEADTNFATPAIADLYGNGQSEIIEGGDSTAGEAYLYPYTNGGHIRVLSQTGNAGQPEPNDGLDCQYNTDQVVQSSPAVGNILGGGAAGIVVGTGAFYAGASQTDHVLAVTSHCQLAWSSPTLDGVTTSSPALVDALGNGSLQVAEGTNTGNANTSGGVYLLDGATGRIIWGPAPVSGAVIGGITGADLGAGHDDLVVPTTGGLDILDGATGALLATEDVGQVAFQNSALISADADGTVGITVAGYDARGSEVDHFEVAGSNAADLGRPGTWPEFHDNPQLTGSVLAPPRTEVPCRAPVRPEGYWEVGGDGGIFTFGDLPFCGSTGGIVLNRPVVSMAGTPSGGGYWTVASDGGIFSFGDAGFYGSTGGITLARPVVGMARTPDGRGYWMVASDGGIFSFGDAHFYGSTGGIHLDQPIVGMAPTPDGGGYWLVAADGGVFSFGDAHFYGSTGGIRLDKPIVAIVPDAATGGYWLVARDGGVFSFRAPFYGSTGDVDLVRPIVAAQATGNGAGYRFEAGDGGVFDFGAAPFFGSEGGKPLAAPVVSSAGY